MPLKKVREGEEHLTSTWDPFDPAAFARARRGTNTSSEQKARDKDRLNMPLAVQLKHFENEKAWNDDSDEGTSQAKKESKPDPLGLTIRPRQAADDSAVAPAAATAPNEDEILGRLQAYMNKFGEEEDVAAATPAKSNEKEVLDRIMVYMNKDGNSPWTDKKKPTSRSEETTTCDEEGDEANSRGGCLFQDMVEPDQEVAGDMDSDIEPSNPKFKQVILDIAFYQKHNEHHKKNIKIRVHGQ